VAVEHESGMTSAVVVKDIQCPHRLGSPSRSPVYTGVAMTTEAYVVDSGGNKVANIAYTPPTLRIIGFRFFDNQWNDITSTVVSNARRVYRPTTSF